MRLVAGVAGAMLLMTSCSTADEAAVDATEDGLVSETGDPVVSAWFFQNNNPDTFAVLDTWAANLADYNEGQRGSPSNVITRVYFWYGTLMASPKGECPNNTSLCLQYADASRAALDRLRTKLPDTIEVHAIVDTPSEAETEIVNGLGAAEAQTISTSVIESICAAGMSGAVFDIEKLDLGGGQSYLYDSTARGLRSTQCPSAAGGQLGVFAPASTLLRQISDAGALAKNDNLRFELSMYDISDGSLSGRTGYNKRLATVLDNDVPALVAADVPYSFSFPAAGAANEHECKGTVDEATPPPYYDLAACEALINNKTTNPQLAYVSAFIDAVQPRVLKVVENEQFRGYSLYQWSYPLGKNRVLPNVPSPNNGDRSEDVLGCVKQALPFSDSPSKTDSGSCSSSP